MNRWEKFVYKSHPYVFVSLGGICAVLQIVSAVLFFNQNGSSLLGNAGWVVLWTAGFFGIIPIVTFRRKGGVPKGHSYMKTTKLVDTGVYALVRHPQNGVAWILINLGIMLVAQNWFVVLSGCASMGFGYLDLDLDLLKEEQRCTEKFGDPYKQYMKRVPRINFVLGIVRWMRRNKQ
jgi:protein-S-isoprenylcysteine O-methyltransferase Ste14